MSDEIAFLDHLGEQLRTAPGAPRPSRGPVVRRVGGVVVLLLIATLGFATFRSEPVAAGVDVQRVGNRVKLRIEGAAPPASEIEEVAHRNGLDIRVREEPVGPSLVGQLFFESSSPAGGLDGVRFGPDDAQLASDHGFDAMSFPLNWKGYITLVIGRAAHAGEDRYWGASNALLRGELLACQRGATAEQVRAIAERRHFEVVWTRSDGTTFVHQVVPVESVLAVTGYRLAYALATGPHSVRVEFTPGGAAQEPRTFEELPSC